MGNQQSAYAKTKTQIRFEVTVKLIIAFVFATQTVQFLYFLNPKFPAISHLLCLYRSVCVRAGRKPHRWFSHDMAQFILLDKCLLYPGKTLTTFSPDAVHITPNTHTLPFPQKNTQELMEAIYKNDSGLYIVFSSSNLIHPPYQYC